MDSDLPKGFTYQFLPSEKEDLLIIRIKEVKDKVSAEAWFEEYKNTTCWTWRVTETFPNSGRVNIYKKKFRCQHNVCYPKVINPKRKVLSKDTGCLATLTISVKKYIKKSRSKNQNYHLNHEWPCQVEFFHKHNHEMMTATALKYWPVSDESKNKLLALFTKRLKAGSVLNDIKHKICMEKDLQDIEESSFQESDIGNKIEVAQTLDIESTEESKFQETNFQITEENSVKGENSELLPGALDALDIIFNRIKSGINDRPNLFIPAVNQMMLNYESFVTTDQALISSMSSFGKIKEKIHRKSTSAKRRTLNVHSHLTSVKRRKHIKISERNSKSKKPIKKRSIQFKTNIGVRPISIKKALARMAYDYTPFASVPFYNKAEPYSLQEVIFSK